MPPEFPHDRLDVYRISLDYLTLAEDIADKLPRGRSFLADQLRRAAASIPLNIAEGAGEFAAADKARFYRIARRSATESVAALDVGRLKGLIDAGMIGKGRELLFRIVSMLTVMVLRLQPRTGTNTDTITTTEEPGTGTNTNRGSRNGNGNGDG